MSSDSRNAQEIRDVDFVESDPDAQTKPAAAHPIGETGFIGWRVVSLEEPASG